MTAADQHGNEPGRSRLIVTIDGPAGTGKSTASRALAGRLGLEFLDTGAMYRAATALALDRGVSLADGPTIAALVREAALRFDWTQDPPALLAFGESVMHRLRQDDVSAAVSPVSALPQVREALVEMQRRIGRQHPLLVTEGRDQGSVVFPDAEVKIYLHASARVRAQRRAEQLIAAGSPADAGAIERELTARDQADSTRAVGPLVRPPEAVDLDTSGLEFDEVIDALERIVRGVAEERAHAAGGAQRGGGR